MAAQDVIGETTVPNAKLGERGDIDRSPPGDVLLSPRERSGSLGRVRVPTFSEAFPSRDFFRVLGFSIVWKAFVLINAAR